MAGDREGVLDRRTARFQRSRELGHNLDEERQAGNLNQRELAVRAGELINEGTPVQVRERLVRDAPPQGAFDGFNATFTLSSPVFGLNILVDFVNFATGVHTPLVRTENPAPGAGAFFFSLEVPTSIVVGTPPNVGDALIVSFLTI